MLLILIRQARYLDLALCPSDKTLGNSEPSQGLNITDGTVGVEALCGLLREVSTILVTVDGRPIVPSRLNSLVEDMEDYALNGQMLSTLGEVLLETIECRHLRGCQNILIDWYDCSITSGELVTIIISHSGCLLSTLLGE